MKTENTYWPETMFLELTTRCNLRCIMCASIDNPTLQKGGELYGDMDIRTLDNLEQTFKHLKSINLNGHGETLLSNNFLFALKKIKQYGLRAHLTSNALLLTEDIARAMVENGLNTLIVSIHAATPSLYAEISRGGNLEKLKKNLLYLEHFKKAKRTSYPKLIIQFVSMKRNIAQLEEILLLTKELGADQLSILKLVEYDLVQGEALDNHPELIKKYLPPAMQLAVKKGIIMTVPSDYLELANIKMPLKMTLKKIINAAHTKLSFNLFNFTYLSKNVRSEIITAKNFLADSFKSLLSIKKNQQNEIFVKKCLDPWTLIFVSHTGDIKPCCNISKSYGNIFQQTIKEIWFNDNYSELRNRVLSENQPSECKSCSIRPKTTLGELATLVSQKTGSTMPHIGRDK